MAEEISYEQLMRARVLDIEATIGEHLANGHTPECLIGTDRTIRSILSFMGLEPDWNNPDGVFIELGDGQVVLRIFRTFDIKQEGKIFVR